MPDPAAAHVQGDQRQAMPEVPAPVAAQRAGDRLDPVPPHQPHVIAVAAERERGIKTGHLALHAHVVGELAQPLRGRAGVRSEDLLDGEHVSVQGSDHPGDRLVMPPGLRRVGGEQVEQVVRAEPDSLARRASRPGREGVGGPGPRSAPGRQVTAISRCGVSSTEPGGPATREPSR